MGPRTPGSPYEAAAIAGLVGAGGANRLHELAEYRRALASEGPLSLWAPWVGPAGGPPPSAPFSSQRSALLASLAPGVVVSLVVGGNRSGKTEIGRILPAVLALGREHPAVRRWAALRRVPLDLIPSGPGRICMVARSSNDSIRYHRPQIARLLPPGQRWRNYGGRGEAHVSLGGGSPGALVPEIWFKSAEQGRDGLQGDAFRAVVVDEELLGPDGSECMDELLLRVADERGRIIHTFSPLAGRTWTYRRFVAARPPGTVVSRMRATDNPHVSPDFLNQIYAGLPEAIVRARRDGEFVALEGSVYPFDPDVHVTDEPPPDEWPTFSGQDFGFTNPTSVVWVAVGPDREVVVIASYHGSGQTTADHLTAFRAVERGRAAEVDRCSGLRDDAPAPPGRPRVRGPCRPIRPPEVRWIDPSAAEPAAAYQAGDYEVRRARNDWAAGRDALLRAMSPGPTGPRLRILRGRAPDLERSIAAYSYPPARDGVDATEKPAARDDHAPDALRYVVLGVERYFGWLDAEAEEDRPPFG